MRSFSCVLVLLFTVGPVLAQPPQSPTPAQLLQEALDREARCRQSLAWVASDGNASQAAQYHLLKERFDRLQGEYEVLKKQQESRSQEPADAPRN